jgi:hypothetical protein
MGLSTCFFLILHYRLRGRTPTRFQSRRGNPRVAHEMTRYAFTHMQPNVLALRTYRMKHGVDGAIGAQILPDY